MMIKKKVLGILLHDDTSIANNNTNRYSTTQLLTIYIILPSFTTVRRDDDDDDDSNVKKRFPLCTRHMSPMTPWALTGPCPVSCETNFESQHAKDCRPCPKEKEENKELPKILPKKAWFAPIAKTTEKIHVPKIERK